MSSHQATATARRRSRHRPQIIDRLRAEYQTPAGPPLRRPRQHLRAAPRGAAHRATRSPCGSSATATTCTSAQSSPRRLVPRQQRVPWTAARSR